MRPMHRLVSAAVLIALCSALSGCGSMSSFDPADLLDFLDTKKKLPGDRKPVFPEGVPGLQQGVPKELYRGGNSEQPPAQPPIAAAPAAAPEPTASKSKSKGRVNVGTVRNAPAAEAPAAADEAAIGEEGAAVAVPAEPKGRKINRRRTTAPPADSSAAPAEPAQSGTPGSPAFPAPVQSGTFSR
ncbi:hypothetical protein [Tardiphaga sp.]|uniref:hypothetical protein n=1 Tax=Tardiphaga sp. TaxID=1926292 RepID=UPI0025CC2127|nr:hypothetical protein [Tardiphaga sp.]